MHEGRNMRINFDDPGLFEQLEDRAIDGQLDYADFPPEEYKYFSQLTRLGYLNRHKGWSADVCEQKQEEYREQYYKHCENRDARLRHEKKLLELSVKGSDLLRTLNTTEHELTALSAALRYIELIREEESGLEKRVFRHIKERYT